VNIVIAILFSLSVLGLESVSEYVGAASPLGKFNNIIEFYFDFLIIVLLIWVSEGLFGRKIHKELNDKKNK
jgi:hypothetical protein